jgi:hypothetical protein
MREAEDLLLELGVRRRASRARSAAAQAAYCVGSLLQHDDLADVVQQSADVEVLGLQVPEKRGLAVAERAREDAREDRVHPELPGA